MLKKYFHNYSKMKIVYCTDNLCYLGGIQRVTIDKANHLSQISGNEIWIIVADNRKPPIFQLDAKIHLISLDINYSEDDWKGTIYLLRSLFVKRRLHKKKLSQCLKDIQPDVVISTGTAEKNFLPQIKIASKPVFIREMHFYKHYRKSAAQSRLQYLLATYNEVYDFCLKIKKYDRIVVLTEQEKKEYWNNSSNVIAIPNPYTNICALSCNYSSKIVVSAGRLSLQKNFHDLIEAWKLIYDVHPDWQLQIWGDGPERENLSKQIRQARLEDVVHIKGFTNEIQKQFSNASIFALSSTNEGWGLVIVEAMALGLPAVSYDCPCGPQAIISDSVDGYLVPCGNIHDLSNKICNLIDQEELRIYMGNNALKKAKLFSKDIVIEKWMCLFNELLQQKHGK